MSSQLLFGCLTALGLQQCIQRFGGVGKLRRIDGYAPFDQPANGGDVALGVDAERIGDGRAVELEQQRRLVIDLPAHPRARLRDRPAHALDVEIVLLRPERRHRVVGGVAAGRVASDRGAVLLRVPPVLQPHRTVGAGEARAVAGGEDRGLGGAAAVVDQDAVLQREPRRLRQRIVGHRAGADHDEIGGERLAGLRHHREPAVRQALQARAHGAGADVDAVVAMALVDDRCGLLVAHARENARRDLDDRHLDAELGGRRGDLEPDHAAADQQQRLRQPEMRP